MENIELSTLDWTPIASAIVAFLALLASMFSAIGAARSADVARSAEERMRAGEEQAAARELMRTTAKVAVEASTALKLLDECASTVKGVAMLAGGAGGSREKLANDGYDTIRAVVLAALSACEGLPVSASETHVRQLELDRSLIVVQDAKEHASRELELLHAERIRMLNQRTQMRAATLSKQGA